MASSTSEAALKLEIARLTGAINNHKSKHQATTYSRDYPTKSRSNTYINPNYKPPTNPSHFKSSQFTRAPATSKPPPPPAPGPSQAREVVIDGVAFQSSGRSLVRKDLPKPATAPPTSVSFKPVSQRTDYSRTQGGHLIPSGRVYKPKVSSRGRRGRTMNRNMTLNNNRSSYQSRRSTTKRLKCLDKPCPRFTTTGACSRGLTCVYQHDANKIAICWNFLQGCCPNDAAFCNLSHDPTPERTPLCVHFANNGRCTRDKCPFPHVRVGPRQGVCRDFAVLGYCDKGLDCDMQHVRECPDFAEKGTFPHVIRANRKRKVVPTTTMAITDPSAVDVANAISSAASNVGAVSDIVPSSQNVSVEEAQAGDEYISLMFNESEDDSEDDEEEGESDEEDDDDDDDEEGNGPSENDQHVESE
ncbi:hypothetical protein SERLADRAFT_472853 [Serpula lacrymans var. lacrymans S7.9]|uniref:C3H1-type domain-containing protein n=1 Tax=Serpula lacrymans var. lacrymans (strain S7.9) TaxID=578457 RepID=F8P428_SERL9|nr:uncharacterized protein SERLADRAFT_472853 [Serpula lacrymans var. lacrymans S7.9]EGO22276.1 hypothetical protein SERLADRAFT_472853 [Serpula lacrymans var. lacrymans S7.9]